MLRDKLQNAILQVYNGAYADAQLEVAQIRQRLNLRFTEHELKIALTCLINSKCLRIELPGLLVLTNKGKKRIGL